MTLGTRPLVRDADAVARLVGEGATWQQLHGPVRQLLTGLATDPTDVVGAWWHPLGCLYVELARDRRRSVRVHVWGLDPSRRSGAGFELHSHDFDLRSVVLTGALDHVEHVELAGPPTHQVYDIEYRGDVNTLRPTGRRLRCAAGMPRRVGAGRSYGLAAGRLHRAVNADCGPTATFVVATLGRADRSLVLGPLAGSRPVHTVRECCPRATVQAAMSCVLARLDGDRLQCAEAGSPAGD